MYYKTFGTSNGNGSEKNFKSLNNNEMNSLRGGGNTEPPLPPPSGDDYPIDPFAKAASYSILLVSGSTLGSVK